MNPSWQLVRQASIIPPLLSAILSSGDGVVRAVWAECAVRSALLVATWGCARRTIPREYLQILSLVMLSVGALWSVVIQRLNGGAINQLGIAHALDAAVGCAGLTLCSRLAARRIWFVPRSLAQPGWRIMGTAAVAATIAIGFHPGVPAMETRLPGMGSYLVVPAFLALQLLLQVTLTPWLIDKRRLPPIMDSRPAWLYTGYLVFEMLMAGLVK